MDQFINILICVSVFLYAIAQIPQVIKSLRTGSTKDISLLTLIICFIAALLSNIFGFYYELIYVWAPASCNLCLTSIIIALKISFDHGCCKVKLKYVPHNCEDKSFPLNYDKLHDSSEVLVNVS
jgi:uncharacterized protein with PQ loop repeat